jgi:hypothetical protein
MNPTQKIKFIIHKIIIKNNNINVNFLCESIWKAGWKYPYIRGEFASKISPCPQVNFFFSKEKFDVCNLHFHSDAAEPATQRTSPPEAFAR